MEATHTWERHCVDCGTHFDSVPREIFNALEATGTASSNRDEELAGSDIEGHDGHDATNRSCDKNDA